MCEMRSGRMPSLLRGRGILSCDFAAHRDHYPVHHRRSRSDDQMSRSLIKGSFTFILPIFSLPGRLFRLEAPLDVTPRFPPHRYQCRREGLETALDTRLEAPLLHSTQATSDRTAKVIGIPYVLESPEIGIAGINCRHLLGLFHPQPGRLFVAFLSLAIGTVQEHVVLFTPASHFSFGVCWNELFFHKLVQFIQVHVGKDG